MLHSICINHALIDGNERLAWAAAPLTEVLDIARELRKLYV